MPKPRAHPDQASTISDILDTSITQAVLQPPRTLPTPSATIATTPPTAPTSKPGYVMRQFRHTRDTDAAFQHLQRILCHATQAPLTRSHIQRALLRVIATHLPALEDAAQHLPTLALPKNDAGYDEATAALETELAHAIATGLRSP